MPPTDDPAQPRPRLIVKFAFDPKRDDPVETFFWDEPAEAPQFYILFGRIMALWGRIEMHLIRTLERVWHLNPREAPERMPHELSRRLRMLKEIFRDAPELAPFAEAIGDVLADARATGRRRHDLYHSLFWNFSATEPRRAVFYRLSPPRETGGDKGRFLSFQEQDLVLLMGEIGRLSERLIALDWNVTMHLRALGREAPRST